VACIREIRRAEAVVVAVVVVVFGVVVFTFMEP
jgi:hypothetical protein